MADLSSTLSSYVAPPVVAGLAAGARLEPSAERIEAAVLFADVSGFTRLAEALVAEGASAPERLSTILNGYFGRIIDRVVSGGGVVYDFAGDAVISVWQVEGSDAGPAVRQASHCALELVRELHEVEVADGMRLSLRTSVGLGSLWNSTMSGSEGRWHFIAAGSSFDEAVRAQEHAGPGQAMVCGPAWRFLDGCARGDAVEDGCVRLIEVEPPPHRSESRARRIEGSSALEPLRAFVPEAVLAAADSGSTAWRAELRKVVVMFLRLDGLRYDADGAFRRVGRALRVADDILHRYGSAIHQFVVDDKGTIVLAAWGLPGSTFENNASRGLSAGAALSAGLVDAGEECSIGIAAGRVFCGDRGSEIRREYAMIGATVNQAARLMAVADGRVLCDDSVRAALESERIGSEIALEPEAPVTIKGSSEPVPVYRPRRARPTEEPDATVGELIGREAEKEALFRAVDDFRESAPGKSTRAVIIEGEAGIGKSRLMAILSAYAEEAGLRVLSGAASAIENTAPYHAWRPVFESVFGLAESDGPGRAGLVHARLEALLPDAVELVPLLNPVIGLDLPDTALTGQMRGEARANVATRLLTRLLAASVSTRGAVVRMEDAHWLDSASWTLLASVRQNVDSVLLVVSTRPMTGPTPRGYDQVVSGDANRIRPGALTWQDLARLVPLRLGVKQVDDEILDFVFERGAGNPFFTEEIGYALRDGGHLAILAGRCSLRSGEAPLDRLIPATIEGTVATRIDRLDPAQQLTLKVASVIERDFALNTLQACHPVRSTREELLETLHQLTRVDLTVQSAGEPDPSFTFKHAITQQVAYDMLPYSQKRGLHLTLAHWYEESHADNLAPVYAVLAHHFAAAQATDKAVVYLDHAGQQALTNDANREALEFFGRAGQLQGIRDDVTPAERLSLATRDHGLSEAFRRLGKIPESEERLRRALFRLGRSVPRGRVGALAGILGRALHQARSRVREGSTRLVDPTDLDLDSGRLAYLLYDRFTRIAFLNMSTDLTVFGTLSSLAEAERLGPSPELARAYANMCGAAGLIPLQRLARMYERKALETLEAIGESDTLAVAFALQVIAVFTSGVGDWDRTERYLRKTIDLFERFGDWSETAVTMQMLSRWAAHRALFREVGEIGRRMMEFSRTRDALVEQTWSVNNQVESLLFGDGEAGRCVELCRKALDLLQESGEASARALTNGLLATAHVRKGEFEVAAEAASRSTSILSGMQPTSYGMLVAYATTVWSWLDCLEAALGDGRDAAATRAADGAGRALRHIDAFARVFPIGEPRARLARARHEALRGRGGHALREASRALTAAERIDMPYETLLAHLEIGRMDVGMALGDRMRHLEEARRRASGLGIAFDEGRATQVLEELSR